MIEVRWDRHGTYEMELEARCAAPPESVYDVLTDLSTHLDWAGGQQYRSFRLLSLEGTEPVRTGTTFRSVGSIPMALAKWEDRSEVVEVRPPSLLAFVTNSVAQWRLGERTDATWEHRYEIDTDGGGSRVRYRLRLASITNPPLRMRLPLMRVMTHKVMIPMFCRRGFRNLVRAAERRDAAIQAMRTLGLAHRP